jgi:hypothetical protein
MQEHLASRSHQLAPASGSDALTVTCGKSQNLSHHVPDAPWRRRRSRISLPRGIPRSHVGQPALDHADVQRDLRHCAPMPSRFQRPRTTVRSCGPPPRHLGSQRVPPPAFDHGGDLRGARGRGRRHARRAPDGEYSQSAPRHSAPCRPRPPFRQQSPRTRSPCAEPVAVAQRPPVSSSDTAVRQPPRQPRTMLREQGIGNEGGRCRISCRRCRGQQATVSIVRTRRACVHRASSPAGRRR